MFSFLTSFEINLATNIGVFIVTLLFSQKIKDFINGVPSDLRTGLKGVESNVISDVNTYQAGLIAKISPPVLKVPPAADVPAPAPAPAK